MTKAEVKMMIDDADFNGDGKLDYEEVLWLSSDESLFVSKGLGKPITFIFKWTFQQTFHLSSNKYTCLEFFPLNFMIDVGKIVNRALHITDQSNISINVPGTNFAYS